MNEVIELLVKADSTLKDISVKDEDVYRMRNARVYLKTAFDVLEIIAAQEQQKEGGEQECQTNE